jgi:poly-gamma-glutamate synthesis protein (capsule biosynthesis protein)
MSDTISIAAVGDIMMGDSHYYVGKGVRSTLEKEEVSHPFEHVMKMLWQKDIVIGNLESVLSDIGLKKWQLASLQYRGKKEFVKYLADANFSVLSLSNNHIMEHGKDAMLESVMALESACIMPVGLPVIHQQCEPEKHIRNIKGVDIAFLAYCLNLERFTQGIVIKVADIISDVNFFKRLVDRVILLLHWGDEFINFPSPKQIRIGHSLVNAGADIILGHHPHVLQGIEIYNGKIIAYSLGNLIFDMDWAIEVRKSMILFINLTKEGPISFNTIPTFSNKKHQPVPASGKDFESMQRRIADLNKEIQKHLHAVVLKQLPKLPLHISAQIMVKPIIRRLFLNKLDVS